jgi:hypothetical protein
MRLVLVGALAWVVRNAETLSWNWSVSSSWLSPNGQPMAHNGSKANRMLKADNWSGD